MRKVIANEWMTLDGVVQALMALGLVDELRLMIDPVVVGGGKRLFRDDGALRPARNVAQILAQFS